MRALSVQSILVSVTLVLASPALGQGYEPANSLPWPLYRQDAPTTPREALGNAFGEFQDFSGMYLHSGIDIRGAEGDVVKVVAGGNIWVTVNYNDDSCTDATDCRIYVKGSDSRYIYYYSHLQLHEESDITAETREKIINASQWSPGTGTYPVQAGTAITAGTVLSRIGPFTHSWPHLHFAIMDQTANYDAINPLTALQRTGSGIDIIDDERPAITDLQLFVDGTEQAVPIPTACTPISGAVDIVATMEDSFYTTAPVPHPVSGGWLSKFGVYEAEYRIRNVTTGTTLSGTWYRFDRAPLECAGPLRGLACPDPLTDAEFANHSFLQPAAGLDIGSFYSGTLFAGGPSSSEYWWSGGENHVHVLTNEWGQAGNWNTTNSDDGWYQVTAIARDVDGNQEARSRFVAVDNHGGFIGPGDVFVRDNPSDVGAIPSTLGGHPFWKSPDIFIVPAGTVPGLGDTPPQTLLSAGTAYDVYLRVHNDSCQTVNNIGAQLYSANPAMIVDSSQWVHLTPDGQFSGSLSLAPGQKGFLGPFPWTPTAQEAESNEGHRCMLAKIDALSDPVGIAAVPDNNNVAQRNLQFDTTSFGFNNPSKGSARIGTELRCNGFPIAQQGALLELTLAYNSALHTAWTGTPGTTVTVSGDQLVVRFSRCNVKLPTVTLPAQALLPASFKAVAPPGVKGLWEIDLLQYSNGSLAGGMSFQARSP